MGDSLARSKLRHAVYRDQSSTAHACCVCRLPTLRSSWILPWTPQRRKTGGRACASRALHAVAPLAVRLKPPSSQMPPATRSCDACPRMSRMHPLPQVGEVHLLQSTTRLATKPYAAPARPSASAYACRDALPARCSLGEASKPLMSQSAFNGVMRDLECGRKSAPLHERMQCAFLISAELLVPRPLTLHDQRAMCGSSGVAAANRHPRHADPFTGP